jgi:hypothetical protein
LLIDGETVDRPAELTTYLDELTAALVAELADSLLGVWLVGSGALGGFSRARSDVDVLMITRTPAAISRRQSVADRIGPAALDCPAQGLEFVWYAQDDVQPLGDPPRFQLNLNGGREREHKVQFGPGDEADHWFVIDLAIARETAVPWFGPALALIVTPVPDRRLRNALRQSLDWHDAADPGSPNRVLNAARAMHYLSTHRWVDKATAGQWLAGHRPDLAPAVRAALVAREQGRSLTPDQGAPVIASVRDCLNR